jgi:HNH endonuclease
MMAKQARPKIKQLAKVKARLQQEINSICPIPECGSTDVGLFEIHHIDNVRTNNIYSNLLLLCPTCHTKITKGDILQAEVQKIKNNLPVTGRIIQFVSVSIDKSNCNWIPNEKVTNAFEQISNGKTEFPILSFSLINNSKKTVLLTGIKLRVKHLPKGISGIPMPKILKSVIKYKLPLPGGNEEKLFNIDEQIEVPASRAIKFQVQLFESHEDGDYPIDGRKVLYFGLIFDNEMTISLPKIFLNCESEDEKFMIGYVS